MTKVHPFSNSKYGCCCCSNNYMNSKRETFTVWMKSLVMQGNGFTVYNNENGQVVYRIDNYDQKHIKQVYLMDLLGNVLFTIKQRKKMMFGRNWEGYKCINDIEPFFKVEKISGIFGKALCCKVSVKSEMNEAQGTNTSFYTLQGLDGKSGILKIKDGEGRVVAEGNRKKTGSGVLLGDDVLNLVIEPQVDHSLIMALVTVYALLCHKI